MECDDSTEEDLKWEQVGTETVSYKSHHVT